MKETTKTLIVLIVATLLTAFVGRSLGKLQGRLEKTDAEIKTIWKILHDKQ